MRKLAIAVLLTMTAAPVMAQTMELRGGGSVLSAPGGRFVFGQLSPYRQDQYMLDTQTGRLWGIVSAGDGANARTMLQPIWYVEDIPEGIYQPTPKSGAAPKSAPTPRRPTP